MTSCEKDFGAGTHLSQNDSGQLTARPPAWSQCTELLQALQSQTATSYCPNASHKGHHGTTALGALPQTSARSCSGLFAGWAGRPLSFSLAFPFWLWCHLGLFVPLRRSFGLLSSCLDPPFQKVQILQVRHIGCHCSRRCQFGERLQLSSLLVPLANLIVWLRQACQKPC